jgi:CopG family nickel-responsive transcriptional regulator
MRNGGRSNGRPVSRISMSLPEELLSDLDRMVAARGFQSRSQAVNDMLYGFLVEHKRQVGDDVMVGIVTLFYDNSASDLQKQLADLQFKHIDEVISSLHVHLMHNQTMEVILVQGPARTLQGIADKMTACRGVISGKMHLIAALIPQLHPFIAPTTKQAPGGNGKKAAGPGRSPGRGIPGKRAPGQHATGQSATGPRAKSQSASKAPRKAPGERKHERNRSVPNA